MVTYSCSQELCRLHRRLFEIVYPFKSSTICCLCVLKRTPSVALLVFAFILFSFQGADSGPETRSKHMASICLLLNSGCGGDKRDRTADLLRAKQALSQLSYTPTYLQALRKWWALVGSNHRPYDYQSYALAS